MKHGTRYGYTNTGMGGAEFAGPTDLTIGQEEFLYAPPATVHASLPKGWYTNPPAIWGLTGLGVAAIFGIFYYMARNGK